MDMSTSIVVIGLEVIGFSGLRVVGTHSLKTFIKSKKYSSELPVSHQMLNCLKNNIIEEFIKKKLGIFKFIETPQNGQKKVFV